MFTCKCCVEKDKRIQDLKSEIQYLRELSLPKVSNRVDFVHFEQDAILNQAEEMPISDEEKEQRKRDEEEAQKILSGTY